MKFLHLLKHDASLTQRSAVSVGNFDGVHLGHQALLRDLRLQADRLHLPLVVVIFEPQPLEYFAKGSPPVRLTSLRAKVHYLKTYGVDQVFCLRFSAKTANLSAEDFAKRVLFDRLNTKYLLIGQDFRFGHQRQGDVELLCRLAKQTDCQVQVYPDVTEGRERISSTNIRQALHRDELQQVAAWLGRPYSICSRVIHGEALGRQWGVPTANLHLWHNTSPLCGIYCAKVKRNHGDMVPGVAYVGSRPTLDDGPCVLEVHLFDVQESLYGERLEVFFLHKLRDEVKFPSLDTMIVQIHADVTAARAYFSS